MKFFKSFFLFLLCFLVFSCVTESGIYSANVSEDVQLYFLRPTQVTVKDSVLELIDFDLTIYTKNYELTNKPIFNYTLVVPVSNIKDADKFIVEITDGVVTLSGSNKSQLLKNIIKDKFLEIRYSCNLDNEDLYALLNNYSQCKLKITYPDDSVRLFDSEELNKKINDLRILML